MFDPYDPYHPDGADDDDYSYLGAVDFSISWLDDALPGDDEDLAEDTSTGSLRPESLIA